MAGLTQQQIVNLGAPGSHLVVRAGAPMAIICDADGRATDRVPIAAVDAGIKAGAIECLRATAAGRLYRLKAPVAQPAPAPQARKTRKDPPGFGVVGETEGLEWKA